MFGLTLLRYRDAADLVGTIFGAVAHLHECGIVHRNLKPENMLFKDPSEGADVMICGFSLSRVVSSEEVALLTESCGTPEASPDLSHPSNGLLTGATVVHGTRDLFKE